MPATGKPDLSQKEMHASFVMSGPLKFDHCGSDRGVTVSVKHPEYDHDGFEEAVGVDDDVGVAVLETFVVVVGDEDEEVEEDLES